jgi:PAS domain S-box-containing protein
MPDASRLWASLASSIDCFVTVIDPDLRICSINTVAAGYDPVGVVGRKILDFVHPDDVERVRAEYDRLFATGESIALDVLAVDDQGQSVPYSVRGAAVIEGGRAVAAVLTAHDQRQRLAGEASLRAERTALRALLETLERERRVISYEIHDGLAQSVASAAMHLDACTHAVAASAPGAACLEDLTAARRRLASALEEARRLINGLRPPMLDELGLLAAIESLVIEAAGAGLVIEYDRPETLPALAPEVATALFRIVQESLSNVGQHAGARRVRVAVTVAAAPEGGVAVEITDDGAGFDPRAAVQEGFGLEGIRQRARLFGREATVSSTPGRGTRIAVTLPATGAPGPRTRGDQGPG